MRTALLLTTFLLIASGLVGPPAFAQGSPDLLNYQGVLRDASGIPLDGAYEMVFEFWTTATGGSQVLLDRHLVGDGNPVAVSDGLFNVALGSGTVVDGTSSGTYASLAEVFRDHNTVYLKIIVGGEALSPRVQILSAGYALNADHLDGREGSEFINTSSVGQMKHGTLALDAAGASYGLEASGGSGGGFFSDNNGTGRAYVARSNLGIDASGSQGGGYFEDTDGTSYAEAAVGDVGIEGRGDQAGGFFQDQNDSGNAFVGKHELGIEARGNVAGGFFLDNDSSGYAYVGSGDAGVYGYGDLAGGYFEDLDESGRAYLGYGETGVRGYGDGAGGYFYDSNGSGFAYAGQTDFGINAGGNSAGAYLRDSDSTGEAWVGYSNYGIYASGSSSGAYFADSNQSGFARVGYGDRGIWARGTFAGGTFSHPDGVAFWADVSTSTRKIVGTGTVSFVQNHPYEEDKVIVYAAPEGDEAAVYTRGTARLVGGEAHVRLGETFRYVANPDIGLTAHVTPKGAWADLYVVSLTTDELVVASRESRGEADFDYLVYGLRLGFEELGIVREKEREAFPPTAETIQSAYRERPELRAFNALERFRGMRLEMGDSGELDMTGSREILAALEEQRAVAMARVSEEAPEPSPKAAAEGRGSGRTKETAPSEGDPASGSGPRVPSAEVPLYRQLPVDEEGNVYAPSFRSSAGDLASLVSVRGAAEAGDVLVADAEWPGGARISEEAADPRVLGIAAAEAGVVLGASPPSPARAEDRDTTDDGSSATAHEDVLGSRSQVPVALSGITFCKVDAGYGSIAVGDLLTTSPTAGHAMRADDPRPGTVLAKALQPLDAGAGLIRVLVMPR